MSGKSLKARANAATSVLRREAMEGNQAAQALFDEHAPTAAQRKKWERKEAKIEAKASK